MNKTVTITSKNHNSNTYGGNICASDFCTDCEGTRNIAERIINDWRFDKQCKKNSEARKRNGGKDITKWQ